MNERATGGVSHCGQMAVGYTRWARGAGPVTAMWERASVRHGGQSPTGAGTRGGGIVGEAAGQGGGKKRAAGAGEQREQESDRGRPLTSVLLFHSLLLRNTLWALETSKSVRTVHMTREKTYLWFFSHK